MIAVIYYQVPEIGLWVYGAPIILFMYSLLFKAKKRALQAMYAQENQPFGLIPRQKRFFWLYALSLALSFIFAVIALMQPTTAKPQHQEAASNTVSTLHFDEIAFLIDVSASMSAADTKDHTARLEVAKNIAKDITDQLGGIYVSLYAFAGDTVCKVPATTDLLSLHFALSFLAINDTKKTGTDIAALMQTMKQRYIDSPMQKKPLFVFFSDGEDTVNTEKDILDNVAPFYKASMPWFTIGIGTQEGATVPNVLYEGKPVISHENPQLLAEIANTSGGNSYFAQHLNSFQVIGDLLARAGMNKAVQPPPAATSLADYPLAACLFFLIIALLLPESLESYAKKTSLGLLLVCGTLYGDINDTVANNIILAKAARYELAISNLQGLLATNLSELDRAYVLYNIATIYIMMGDGDDAEKTFREIELPENAPAAFVDTVYHNSVLTTLTSLDNALKLPPTEAASTTIADRIDYAEAGIQHIQHDEAFKRYSIEKLKYAKRQLEKQKFEVDYMQATTAQKIQTAIAYLEEQKNEISHFERAKKNEKAYLSYISPSLRMRSGFFVHSLPTSAELTSAETALTSALEKESASNTLTAIDALEKQLAKLAQQEESKGPPPPPSASPGAVSSLLQEMNLSDLPLMRQEPHNPPEPSKKPW